MIAYSYNNDGYYTGTYSAQKDPMQAGRYLLPARATWVQPPSNNDATKEPKWGGSSWSLVKSRAEIKSEADAAQAATDAAALAAAMPTIFRQQRDAKIVAVEWMRSRHLDQIAMGSSTTLTNNQYRGLLVYIQALRDLPSHTPDPANPTWPNKPSYIP